MRHNGHINLQQNFLKNVSFEPVENFPEEPVVGSFIFKDKRVMICVELDEGLPFWLPLTAQRNTFIYSQPTPSATWVIDHDLNTSNTIINLIGADGKHFNADEITQTFNQTTITMIEPMAGKAILVNGQEDGYDRPVEGFTMTFEDATSVTVNHLMGEEPIIRVFIENQEVQPLSIVHNSENQATVTFSTPRSGKIRCVL